MIDIKYEDSDAGSRSLARRRLRLPVLVSLALVLAMLTASAGLLPSAQALARPGSPDATTITFSPDPATVNGCETIEVGVWINDVEGLYGADVRVSFDPAVLEVVDALPASGIQVRPGTLLKPPLWTIRNTANNTTGQIIYAATQISPTLPYTGSGLFYTILFRAKSEGTSSLGFTYTKLSTRDGFEIPSTPVAGSANTIPPANSTVSIARLNSTTARLTWTASAGIAGYHLYRDTMPYFAPTAPPYVTTTGLTYDDVGALGDVVIQYYYVVRSACATGFESANSNRVGAYDYPLSSAHSANYADIAMVLQVAGVNDAASLATYIGSFVLYVTRYNASTQSFQIYIVGDPDTNYPLAIGDFVFVVTSSAAPASTALVGGVPDPGSVSFNLVSGMPPRYNFLSLPLDRDDLDWASDVAGDVGTGVYSVVRYQTGTQSYQAYFPGDPDTDFPLVIGEPFGLILLSGAPSHWPEYPLGGTQLGGWNDVQR